MFDTDAVEGIHELEKKLPEALQYWHKWGNIAELHHRHVYRPEHGDDICCIEMVLQDIRAAHAIRVSLFNVSGRISFDTNGGFYSGLTIEDCAAWGYEPEHRFRISSLEQDLDLEIYCETIKVALIR